MEKTKITIGEKDMCIEEVLNAPLDLVWKAWSHPEHIALWWGPNGFTNTIHKMDLKPGGDWLLTMHGPDGKDYPNKSTFVEVVPKQKIVYRHYNPNFTATIVFEALENKTRIKWSSVFETKKMFENVVIAFKADEGMKQNVEKLGKFLLEMKK
ncbi:MAG: SRPBCC family protein [Bacteroidales bacterium]